MRMIMIIVIIVYRGKPPLHSLTMGYLFAITVSQEREVTVVLLVGHHPKTSSDFVKRVFMTPDLLGLESQINNG